MERKTYKLPTHPRRGKQQVVVERPAPDSVWYLVVEPNKAKPLPNLKNPKSAKDVLDALAETCGDNAVVQYMAAGYSKL